MKYEIIGKCVFGNGKMANGVMYRKELIGESPSR